MCSNVLPLRKERYSASTVNIEYPLKFCKSKGIFDLGEAFVKNRLSNHPETKDLAETIYNILSFKSLDKRRSFYWYKNFVLSNLVNPQVGIGSYLVAKKHYDLNPTLFDKMLDPTLSYTSGVWKGCVTLEEAQKNKLKILCEKLQLKAGMRVLDIGCGWGNFAEYAAINCNVEVVGVTVSERQRAFAEKRVQGLPVKIELKDYREIKGQFDRVVSIEMIEAVGKKNITKFFEVVKASLKPNGIFVLQVISGDVFNKRSNPALDMYIAWLQKYIFPNGYLPSISELTASCDNSFYIEKLEEHSADYIRTLRAWENNFLQAWDVLALNFDEEFKRKWLFYLCGCQAFFQIKAAQLYQIVYKKR